MDTEVILNETEAIVKVPLFVPRALFDSGAVEALAIHQGWSAKITGPEGVEIDNPLTPLEYNDKKIRDSVKSQYRSIVEQQGEEQGRKQAVEMFDKLFSNE